MAVRTVVAVSSARHYDKEEGDLWDDFLADMDILTYIFYVCVCVCHSLSHTKTDRMAEMERQNGILLNKLYRIQTRSKGDETTLKDGSRALNPGEACRNRVHSLNSTARKQELERIAVENVAILRRIQERQTKPSDFDKKKLDEDWLQRQKYSRLASKCQSV